MRSRNTLNALVGLLFVVSAALGAYLVARAIWGGFTSLESGTASAVAAAAGAVLLAIINIVAQRYVDRRRDIEARQRDKKIELYQKFMTYWFNLLLSLEDHKARAGGAPKLEVVGTELNDITQQLILWGSDGVLKAHSDFRRLISSTEREPHHAETLLKFEAVLYQFRKDLGHSNRKLKERDILALFVNDVDKLDPPSVIPPTR